MTRNPISAKLTAASAAALALSPAAADAAPVYVTDRPVTVSFDALTGGFGNASVGWDIDGVNGDDTQFGVWRAAYSTYTDTGGDVVQIMRGGLGFPGVYGIGPVLFAREPMRGWLASVQESNTVSRQLVTDLYTHAPPPVNGISTFGRLITPPGGIPETLFQHVQGALTVSSSQFGQRLMLFGFDFGGELHLGWARVRFDDAPDPKVVIERWAYESEPNTEIHVNNIPSPPAAIPALTLLAFGAAGVRRWRKRQATNRSRTTE